MADCIDVLLNDEKTKVVVCGKEYFIGRLKLKTVLRLVKFLSAYFVSQQEKISKFKPSETNAQDILSILELLDETELAKAIAILLDTDDVLTEIEFESIADIVEAVCKHNDLEKILGKIKRVAKLIQKK